MIGDPRARSANRDLSSRAPDRVGAGFPGAPVSRRHAREARTSEEDAGKTPGRPRDRENAGQGDSSLPRSWRREGGRRWRMT